MSSTPPPPPDEPAPPPEAESPEPAEAGSCPRCGSAYAPGQEYCLECGLRLPLVRGFIPSLGQTWQRHFRWYPGDWIWPVVLGLVIAAAGATVAILTTRDDASGSKTIIATGGTETGETSTTTPDTTGTTGTTETETTETETTATTTETTPTETTPTGPIKWPPGKTGFTIVLASISQTAGLATAREAAQKALGAGLSDVGILNSSNYSNLNPGYYVVFAGVHDTIAEAQANLETAKSAFPQAYTRKIAP